MKVSNSSSIRLTTSYVPNLILSFVALPFLLISSSAIYVSFLFLSKSEKFVSYKASSVTRIPSNSFSSRKKSNSPLFKLADLSDYFLLFYSLKDLK
jgi:hypothetical protein